MTARWLAIADRHRRHAGWNASLADFTVEEGDATGAEVLLRNPGLSLYSLEVARREAIFAEVPAAVDLSAAPFVFQRQYETATRLLAVPFADLLGVASGLPPVERVRDDVHDRPLRLDAAQPCVQCAGRCGEPVGAGRPGRAGARAAYAGAVIRRDACAVRRQRAAAVPHAGQSHAVDLRAEAAQRVDPDRRGHPGRLPAGDQSLPLSRRRRLGGVVLPDFLAAGDPGPLAAGGGPHVLRTLT